ncbi:MAG: hypothetical protein QOE97_3951 [Pseudonocardiales bacterium]|jgi:2-polyprenyl-6-methoxyphenol hydroxylase-like FAD-dependent oxidoreductase|nr:hypothetical protein [Pseudonocardiales bacterium]
MTESYDVVVVGSGPAGSTVAALLGRAGLHVALLEAHGDRDAYKRLCTHFIQSSALPTLQRIGADKAIEAAGGLRNRGSVWTRYGLVREPENPRGRPTHGYNIRRTLLDPILRSIAADTPGVDLVLGAKVRDLTRTGGDRVDGVTATVDGAERRIAARLVVGADGRHSRVAEAAGLPAREIPNERFGYFAAYRNVGFTHDTPGQMWLLDPDAVYAFRNEDGITILATMPAKARLSEFTDDREAALLSSYVDLPGGPDVSGVERVSDVIGTKDYPSVVRKRVTAAGVALIGDAALVGDPLWGVGCGWAVQSAGWLADAVSGPLAGTDPSALDAALRRYGRVHRRRLMPHQKLALDFSSGRTFSRLERLLFAGAVHDPWVADRFYAYGTRNVSPAALLSPRLLLRAARARRRAVQPVSSG